MPNDLSPYIPEMWARETLITLHRQSLMAQLVHRDFENVVAQMGDTVNTRKPQTFTTAQKTVGSDYVDTALSPTLVPVVIDQHPYVSFIIEGEENTLTMGGAQKIFEDNFKPMAKAIAEDVDDALLALYTDLGTSVGVFGTDMTTDTQIDAMEQLNTQNVPKEDNQRFGIISAKDEASILKGNTSNAVSSIARADILGDNSALREAVIGRVAGINWVMSQGVVVDGGGPDVHNMAFHRNAFALVSRAIKIETLGASGVRPTVVSMDGIGMTIHTSWDSRAGGVRVVGEMLYGVKTLDALLATEIKA